jgi:3-deoxy-D-manno-octulosonic-acid transferase
MTAVRLLYNIAFPFVLLGLLPGFLFRMLRRGKYRHKFGQRFAIYSPRVREKLSRGGWTWIHAVSVGEVLIAQKFIRELKRRDPDLHVVLSTTTSTGFALASTEKSDWLEPIYNPVDFLWSVRSAIRLIRPKRLILVEAEIWPNLTAEAKAQGASLSLVNARLSHRSEGRYLKVKNFVGPVFNQLDLLCVQETVDADRWAALGVDREKILVTGSIKFDDAEETAVQQRDFRPALRELGVADDAPILLAGSTHAGEEKLIGEIVLRLRRDFPKLFYVVVPRHAERWRSVRDELVQSGFRVALRVGEEGPVENPDALIVNTTGELRDWYDCATVVFVGKSVTAHGGQNPAEAVAAGKAVVVGPYMENFLILVAQLVRAQGIVQVPEAGALEGAMRELLSNEQKRSALAANGAKCLTAHRGATGRTCVAILQSMASTARSDR